MPALTKRDSRKLWNDLLALDPDPSAESLIQIIDRWEDLRLDAFRVLLNKEDLTLELLEKLFKHYWIELNRVDNEMLHLLISKLIKFKETSKDSLNTIAYLSESHATEAVRRLLTEHELSYLETLTMANRVYADMALRKEAFKRILPLVASHPLARKHCFVRRLREVYYSTKVWIARALIDNPPTYKSSQSRESVRRKEAIAILDALPGFLDELWEVIEDKLSARTAGDLWRSASLRRKWILDTYLQQKDLSQEVRDHHEKAVKDCVNLEQRMVEFIFTNCKDVNSTLADLMKRSDNEAIAFKAAEFLLLNDPARKHLLMIVLRFEPLRERAWPMFKATNPKENILRRIARNVPELKDEILSSLPKQEKKKPAQRKAVLQPKSILQSPPPKKQELTPEMVLKKLLG